MATKNWFKLVLVTELVCFVSAWCIGLLVALSGSVDVDQLPMEDNIVATSDGQSEQGG